MYSRFFLAVCLFSLGIASSVSAQKTSQITKTELTKQSDFSQFDAKADAKADGLKSDKEFDKEKSDKKAEDSSEDSSSSKATNECKFCRWIDLQTATISARYRFVKSNQRVSAAGHTAQPFLATGAFVKTNQAQQQQLYEFDFKFDKAGRYKVHARFSTGEYFTRSFSEVGWGDVFNGENSAAVLPRQFYISAEPVKGLEFQYGGLGIAKGENTEHTTYDNDGFITGQRVKLKRPDKVWFDEISVTYAYIGDFYTPNFFQRTRRLAKSNYHQFLVSKKFGKRAAFSVDYSSHATISHLRQGLTINTKELKFIDSFKAEFYQRLEDYRGVKKGWGYNFQVEKDIKNKLSFTAGLTFTDYRYNVLTNEKYPARQRLYAQPAGTLTADRMIRGLSPFVRWDYKITPYTSVFGFWTTDINKPTPLPFVYNADHFSVGFQLNVKSILKKTGWL